MSQVPSAQQAAYLLDGIPEAEQEQGVLLHVVAEGLAQGLQQR